MKDVDDVKRPKPVAALDLKKKWADEHPRPYWTTEFWTACRPEKAK